MPLATVKSFAEKTGKSVKEVEKMWNRAKVLAVDKFGSEDHPNVGAYTTSILKKMLKLDESLLFLKELQTINEAYYDDENALLKVDGGMWVEVPHSDWKEFFDDVEQDLEPEDRHNKDRIFSFLDNRGKPEVTVFTWKLHNDYEIDYIAGLDINYFNAFKTFFSVMQKHLKTNIDFNYSVIMEHPFLASMMDCSHVHPLDLVKYLQTPEIAKYCDLSTLESDMWLDIISKDPDIADHKQFNKNKMNHDDIEVLFARQPELEKHPMFLHDD